jgi:hypothetical protein
VQKNNKFNPHTAYYILLSALFLAAFLERTVFDLGPNFELLTTAMILSAYFLGGKYSFWLTLLVIAFSDRLIGNSKIFLFTWSGFLIPSLMLPKLFGNWNLKIGNSTKKLISLTGTGILSNLFFYTYTNLGVWLLDSWGMYTKDIPGLVRCYINALPFLKNQIVSSLVFIPTGFICIKFAIFISKKLINRFVPNPLKFRNNEAS